VPEDRTSNSKWQRLFADDIVELILDKDSNAVVSDCDQCDNDVSDNAQRKWTLIISLVINLAKEKIWHPIPCDSTVLMFYSAAFITLLIEGINWYHQHYSDTLNK